MKVIADLHIHSKYARACSRDLNPENLAMWAEKKGITVLGTGDFTHPLWLQELKDNLQEAEPGLFKLKSGANQARFLISGELASIYKKDDKVRRVHNLAFAPSFAAADKFIALLEARNVNLKSDGRPIMGVPCDELLKICKEADENMHLIPAHAWTPHFGVFGSLSGFDSLEQCFGNQTKHIFAIETGLSSDPKMNWQIPALDDLTLISNSDAHSLRKLGREANVLEVEKKALSYEEIFRIIKTKQPTEFIETLEFFPEEGKYHLDGHADCNFSCFPKETKKLGGICPVCGKKLLRGVMHRVDDLGSREWGFTPPQATPFRSIIPLEEIIAETFGVGPTSKKVLAMYEQMVTQIPEFELLLNTSEHDVARVSSKEIAESVMRVRRGQVQLAGGYDGVFGKIQIYSAQERERMSLKPKQKMLF